MSIFLYLLYLCFIWKADSLDECCDHRPIFGIASIKSFTITVFYPYQCEEEELHIFLYHNNDSLSCNNEINGDRIADFIINTRADLNKCSNETKQCFFETNAEKLGYYCGYMIMSRCRFSFYTSTLLLKPPLSGNDIVVGTIIDGPVKPLVWIVCGAIIGFGILICMTYKVINHKLQRNNYTENLQTSDQHQLLYNPIQPKIVQIFVLYHYDDDQHFHKVLKFVNHLEQLPNCEVVADYKCKNEICRMGMATWVSNMLTTSDRVVIISSQGACTKVKLRNNFKITSNDVIDLETAFLCGWVMILADLNLLANYNKLFNIRFEDTDSQFLLPDVVSGRHFQIPCHYENLVYQLTGSKEIVANNCTKINFDLLTQ